MNRPATPSWDLCEKHGHPLRDVSAPSSRPRLICPACVDEKIGKLGHDISLTVAAIIALLLALIVVLWLAHLASRAC